MEKQNTLFEETTSEKVLSLKEILAIPGAKAIMVCFFCYCAVEQTTMLWASSYLNLAKGVDAKRQPPLRVCFALVLRLVVESMDLLP